MKTRTIWAGGLVTNTFGGTVNVVVLLSGRGDGVNVAFFLLSLVFGVFAFWAVVSD